MKETKSSGVYEKLCIKLAYQPPFYLLNPSQYEFLNAKNALVFLEIKIEFPGSEPNLPENGGWVINN